MPPSVRRCWVRGWTGKMTGISAATASMAPRSWRSFSVESTFEGRCNVRTPKGSQPVPFFRPRSSPILDCWATGRKWHSESIITLPTRKMHSGAAFLEKMLHPVFFGDEKIVGDGVGEDAVDLFGHSTVKTAKARFDVS